MEICISDKVQNTECFFSNGTIKSKRCKAFKLNYILKLLIYFASKVTLDEDYNV